MIRTALIASSLVALSACTVVDTVVLPSDPGKGFFVTAGDITEPHDTLGIVQATKSGVLLFGNIDVIGTDLESGFKDVLIPKVKEMGGDGVVRVRYHMTQYTPWARIIGAIFFFAPLPSTVTISGQVVKMRGPPAAPMVPPN